jgi:hypothetical protein
MRQVVRRWIEPIKRVAMRPAFYAEYRTFSQAGDAAWSLIGLAVLLRNSLRFR